MRHNLRYSAKIRWFDAMTGEGIVRINKTRESMKVHFTAFYKPDDNNYNYPSGHMQERLKELLPKGQNLMVEIDESFGIIGAEVVI
ncbi:MAG: hypothetical protein V3V14_08135 [Saprospiraceae bacterium]